MFSKKFQLFQCCIPVKGVNSGIIIDFQRKSFFRVSNQIIDFIEEYKNRNLYELFSDFNDSKNLLKKYIRFFISNELVIVSNDLSAFSKIPKSFVKPYLLDVICLEINKFNIYNHSFFNTKLDELGVKSLKLIIKTDIIFNLKKVLKLLEYSKIQSITLFTEYKTDIFPMIKKIKSKNPRLMEVVFYGINKDSSYEFIDGFYYDPLELENSLYKGVQNSNDFVLDMNVYLESLNYNFAFNRVLYIDELGYIKRYMSDKFFFGNISNEIKLDDALTNIEVIDFWNITKDEIEICKDCEFRYICSDGRVPFKANKSDTLYKHKEKCNYDPYTNQWLN